MLVPWTNSYIATAAGGDPVGIIKRYIGNHARLEIGRLTPISREFRPCGALHLTIEKSLENCATPPFFCKGCFTDGVESSIEPSLDVVGRSPGHFLALK